MGLSLLKEDAEGIAREAFYGSDIHITTAGRHYLGGVIGTEVFEEVYLQQKMQEWISKLSSIVESQPHVAYSAYCHGLSFWWNYLHLSSFLVSTIGVYICSTFIPKLLGQAIPRKIERDLFSFHVWLGGLGLF